MQYLIPIKKGEVKSFATLREAAEYLLSMKKKRRERLVVHEDEESPSHDCTKRVLDGWNEEEIRFQAG